MKVKLFTHTDLDGIGCAILGILSFGKENIDITYCNYNDVNTKVDDFLMNEYFIDEQTGKSNFDKIFMTDISLGEDTANFIDLIASKNVVLLDHHPTALFLNKYEWANVEIMLNDKEKTSGTRMFYDYILNNIPHDTRLYKSNMKSFIEIVRKYDTWQWKGENNLEPKQWNDLLYIMGRDEFIESIIYRLIHYDVFDFCNFDLKLLQYKQIEIDNYIETKDKEIVEKDILGYNAGIIFGEQYHSELGNRLCELHPELDFIVIVNMSKSISYRGIIDEIDLGKDIASVYGGGGHPKAAGSQINDDIREKVLNLIFNK